MNFAISDLLNACKSNVFKKTIKSTNEWFLRGLFDFFL